MMRSRHEADALIDQLRGPLRGRRIVLTPALSQKPNRFLTEILVVGCIVILIAFLVAKTYTRSLGQANRTVCVNNVSQLARAMMAYSYDFDCHVVSGPSWQDAVMPYVSDPPDWNIYYCPVRDGERGYSYGLSRRIAALPETEIPFPSETVMLADVRNSTREVWWANDIRFENVHHNRSPLPCHSMRSNFAFCDGHASTRDPFLLDAGSWMVSER